MKNEKNDQKLRPDLAWMVRSAHIAKINTPVKRGSLNYKRAKFVQKVEHFQLSFTAFFFDQERVDLILFDVITYLFAGARSKTVVGKPALPG